MAHSDPFDRVTGRGWVVLGEGDSEILPGTGRGTSEAGGGGLPDGTGGGAAPLRRAFGAPPPPEGENLSPYFPDPVFTPALKLRFLDELSQHGNVRVAAARTGVSRSGAYLARRRDPGFAAAWRSALCLARDHAEVVLAERALEGVEEPVFYRGEVIAVRRRFDSRLLLAHLARLDALCAAEGAGAEPERFDVMLGAVGELLEDVTPGEVADLPLRDERIAAARHKSGWRGRGEERPGRAAAEEFERFTGEVHRAVDAVRLGPNEQAVGGPDLPFEVKSLGGRVSRQDAKTPRGSVSDETRSAEGQPACPFRPGRLIGGVEGLRRIGLAQHPGVLAPWRDQKSPTQTPPQSPFCTLSIVSTRRPQVIRRAGGAVRRRGQFLVGLSVSLVDGEWSGGERAARQGQPIG